MDIFSAACMFFGGVTFLDYMFPFTVCEFPHF